MNVNHYADAAMMIRKPVANVFDAFVNPEITTKFWFTKSTGALTEGAEVEWSWEMYGVSVPVTVTKIVDHEQIVIKWGEGSQMSQVTWTFNAVTDAATYVTIKNDGFLSEGEGLISQIRDSTGGFTIVLAGLKAYLEHGIELNLIGDVSISLHF